MPRFFALIATSRARSHFSRRLPHLRYVPSSGFRCRSTFFSAHALAGLFHPAATFRVPARSGVFSPRVATLPLRKELPPRRCPASAHRLSPAATNSVLDLEAFIHAKPRSLRRRYSPRRKPLPSSGCSPPGAHAYG
jgi:hypothetical protein